MGRARIHKHERRLCDLLIHELSKLNNIKLYSRSNGCVTLVSFNMAGIPSYKTAAVLSDAEFCLRGDLHCAYLAHKKLNTLETGVVRFAPSLFNTKREVMLLSRCIANPY